MKIVFLFVTLAFYTGTECSGQHFIGLEKSATESLVKKEMKDLNLDESSKNVQFNYLKFVNSIGTKTFIVFFDEKNISVSTRMICDFSELNFMQNELNKKYKKTGKNSWEYIADNNKIEIILEKKEWYFIVSTKKKQ